MTEADAPTRADYLEQLRHLNSNLTELGADPIITNLAARAFDADQLRAAVVLTADRLLRLGQSLGEAGA